MSIRCWFGFHDFHRVPGYFPPWLVVCSRCRAKREAPGSEQTEDSVVYVSPTIGAVLSTDIPWPGITPWTIVDTEDPGTLPPLLEDVLVAYPPNDGDPEPNIDMAWRNRDGRWVLTGDTEAFDGYQHPVCWMHPHHLPELPEQAYRQEASVG